MEKKYSFEQRRQAYLKAKAGPADTVTSVLALLPGLLVIVPLCIYVDNIVISKLIGTPVVVTICVIVHGLIRKPIFRYYYAKYLKESE